MPLLSNLHLTFEKKWAGQMSAGQQHNSTDHHSDQLKNSKFYENSSEYANFSKSSGQDQRLNSITFIW